jgi:hypothetical protein
MTFNEKVEFYKEKIKKNPEKDIIIPHDVYYEITYGKKPDSSLLEGFFDDEGKYIGE